MCFLERIDVSHAPAVSACVHVYYCLCMSVLASFFFFFFSLCVPSRTPTPLCLCAKTIKASHPAALLNYTPRLLKRHPQIRPPRLPRSTLLIPCGIYQRERITMERIPTRYRLYITALTRRKNQVLLCGLVFFDGALEFLPIRKTIIPGTKWVCCVCGFERCHGISHARRRQCGGGESRLPYRLPLFFS